MNDEQYQRILSEFQELRKVLAENEPKPKEPSRPIYPLASKNQMHGIIRLEQALGWKATHTERLIKSLFPKASRTKLTHAQAAILLRKMYERLEVPQTPNTSGTRLKVWDAPTEPRPYIFCGPKALPNTNAEVLSSTAEGPSAYRMLAVVDPDKLDEHQTIAVEDLEAPWPSPDHTLEVEIDGHSEAFRAGTYSLGDFEIVVDQFGDSMEVSIRSLKDQYIQSLRINGELALADLNNLGFPFLQGQTHYDACWNGPEDLEDRFLDGLHVATLIGPDSYSSGGWGPTSHPQPDLPLEFRTELHNNARAEVERLIEGTHPEITSVGPWGMLGPRTGGGTGGGGITPYSAIGVSAGEIDEATWRMKGVMARSLMNSYEWGATGPDIDHPSGDNTQRAAYEQELVRYQRYDQAHASRALIDAMAVFWGRGSRVAGHWLRRQAEIQGRMNPFSEEFHGKGHKHAHRAMGWKAFNWALAASACATPSERAHYQDHCHQIAQYILEVAMPSGITMRSGSQTNPGPFAAWMNPDIIAEGIAPNETTLVRTFMQAIVAYGAYALHQQIDSDSLTRDLRRFIHKGLESVILHDSIPAPKNHFVVGGVEIDSEIVDPYPVEHDQGRCGWEMMFWCAATYGVTSNPSYLRQAAQIAGWGDLEEMIEKEYTRTGSNTAWWGRTPEIYAQAQLSLQP